MSPRNVLVAILTVIAVSLCGSQVALAVWAPEPDSGGKFFRSKGTMASEDYYYLGRTGTRESQDYYYGKGLRAGILNIRPRTSYAREFDSNVNLTPTNKKSDWINRIDSGIDAQAPLEGGKYLLYGGAQSQSEWYVHHSGLNHTDWYFNGGAQANFDRFSFNVFDNYARTSQREGTDFITFNKRNENYLSGLLEVPFARFFFENEIGHYYLKFDDDDQKIQDRWELREIPRIGMDVGGRTQVLAEYAITPIRYFTQPDRDGIVNAPSLGVRGFLGRGDLVSYQAWAGYENRSYNSGSRKEFNGFIGRGDIRWRPSELTELIAEASRRAEEAVNVPPSTWVARNDMGLRYRRKVTDFGALNVGARTGFYDFSDGRDDFYWEAFTRAEVFLPGKLKFASVFGEYNFRQRRSDQSLNNYADNRANFGVKLEL